MEKVMYLVVWMDVRMDKRMIQRCIERWLKRPLGLPKTYNLGKNSVSFRWQYCGQISTNLKKTTWGLEPQKNFLQSETLRNSVALFV